MTGFLLDTNVISELGKPRPNAAVVAFVAAQSEENLFISEATFAEIRFGIEQLGDPERRASIVAWLNRTLRPLFDGRTLAISEDVVLRWWLQLERGRRRGQTFGGLDLIIAATSAENDLIVVSRDTSHFIAAGVPVLDPWEATFTASDGVTRSVEALDNPSLLEALLRSKRAKGQK